MTATVLINGKLNGWSVKIPSLRRSHLGFQRTLLLWVRSCWSELHDTYQEQLVRSLEAAFASPTIPPEIIASLLNLAEFMEHDEKPLPVDIRTLGALAEKCRAYAKVTPDRRASAPAIVC